VTGLAIGLLHLSARRWLGRLHDELGAAGLAAAGAIPGVCAMLDQHAAAVRDATTLGLEQSAAVAGAVLLASYGRGVLDHARRQGWTPPTPDLAAWARADWTSLRLAAVCALAQRPSAPRPRPPDAQTGHTDGAS
jgi:Family of unknown function (DUF6401)